MNANKKIKEIKNNKISQQRVETYACQNEILHNESQTDIFLITKSAILSLQDFKTSRGKVFQI